MCAFRLQSFPNTSRVHLRRLGMEAEEGGARHGDELLITAAPMSPRSIRHLTQDTPRRQPRPGSRRHDCLAHVYVPALSLPVHSANFAMPDILAFHLSSQNGAA